MSDKVERDRTCARGRGREEEETFDRRREWTEREKNERGG